MKGKLFGLYSLENATYFRATQYIYMGKSLLYKNKPQWAEKLKIIDIRDMDQIDINEKLLSRYGFLIYEEQRISENLIAYLAVKKL